MKGLSFPDEIENALSSLIELARRAIDGTVPPLFVDDTNQVQDSERYKLFYFTTSNPDAPACTDYCPIFTSKTLRTVVAKIKTWLEPYP